MTKHHTQFEPTAGGLVLTKAILFYGPHAGESQDAQRVGAAAFASIHSVEDVDGKPTIGAGVPLSHAHLRQWTEAVGRTVTAEILPDNVLVATPDILAWWVPAMMRPSYFALTTRPEGLKALAERVTLSLPYPAHLFVARGSSLGVYALPESKRPTADTVLLHSPVLNVFINGQLCWGNVPFPKARGIAAIPDYERAVFDSWSTHPNPGQELTVTGKGGLVRLWDDLAARKVERFPVNRMKPFYPDVPRPANPPKMTLGRLIAGGGRV